MRRRLTLTMVLLAVGTLLVTGVVTLALTIHTTRQQTRHELSGESTLLARAVQTDTGQDGGGLRAVRIHRILQTFKKPLKLEGSAVVFIGPNGALASPVAGRTSGQPVLPAGLRSTDLDVAQLVAGHTVSGRVGDRVFAAAPAPIRYRVGAVERQATVVVVLVRRTPSGLGIALPWLLVSTLVVLVVAVFIADRVARRTVRPLRAAEAVTARIAAGDLSARVGEIADADPELHNLGSSIDTMAAALASAQGTQRQFLLSVSHELRTPLTSIRGFAEALEDGTATDVGRAAGIISAESGRLERLVSDLLELARLDTGRFSLRPGPVDLSTAVPDAVAAFEPAAAELGVALTTAVEGDGGWVVADPDRLTQIVSNLVENALNYAGGHVRVGASAADGVGLVWVDDDGPGIAPADLPQVFTRLFSSSERRGRRVGSGLGLAIVAELVGSMGGRVRAESPLGPAGGTRMVVTLRSASGEPS